MIVSVLLLSYLYSYLLFSDLQSDMMNPVELCERVNAMVEPQYMSSAVFLALLILRGQLLLAAVAIPVFASHFNISSMNLHRLDTTTILSTVSREKQMCALRLALLLVIFFYTIFELLKTVVGVQSHGHAWSILA
ncbi:hypothetical protein NDN08_002537 [Rhodosorus marinus]|uniref:Uncharacterized protein n=1 Tax=Rhodosorus marinus TaxID=101924 RepID=A0AAV8UY90_9RHOD|nr:hypothetical protein NDN08_002537 [Rhodosorus marinus]